MQKAPRPDSVAVQMDGSTLRLTYRWFTWQGAYTLVIALIFNYIVWTGFVSNIFAMAGGGIAYYALYCDSP